MICFSQADVAAWADFSGDTNPLHRDVEHALAAGYQGLIVPGMLLAMPVKTRLFSPVTARTVQMFFKQPALISTPYTLDQLPQHVHLAASGEPPVMTGRIGPPRHDRRPLVHDLGIACLARSDIDAVSAETLMFRDLLAKLKAMVIWGISGEDLLLSGTLLHLSNTVSLTRPQEMFPQASRVYYSASWVTSPLTGWTGYLHCRAKTECGRVFSEHTFGVKQ